MKIILNQDMSSLGEEGDVKVVADGYARNFLIPKKLAVAYNKANLNMFEQKKVSIEKRKESKRKDAMGLKDRLNNETLVIDMPAGDKGKLFGAVTPATIVDELNKIGIVIEKKKVEIAGNSIKLTGTFTVKVKLYGNESADLKVTINGVQTEGSESRSSRKAEVKVETAAVVEESAPAEVTESAAVAEEAETASENTAE